jgi:hypothetical protein
MSDNQNIFDFDTVKDFSGLIVRQPLEEEALFISVLESHLPDETISEEPDENTEYTVNDENIDAIKNNEALLSEIIKQTTVYDFVHLDIKLFVRNWISITTGEDNHFMLNFPTRRYLLKGESEIMFLQEGDNSFRI